MSRPIDALFWCAGSHGSMYPFTGNIVNESSGLNSSVLLSERMDFKLHREGLILDTVPYDVAVCYEYPSVILPKSRYRYQMVNTISDVASCHPLGRNVMLWQTGKEMPTSKKNYGHRIVLQRGEKHGKVLEATDLAAALQLMKDNPGSPVVLSADYSERPGSSRAAAAATSVASGGEELDRREAEALEKAVKAALDQEDKEPEPAVQDETREALEDKDSEREAALAELQEVEAFDYRDYDLSPERDDRAMMNDEVNVMRHERSEPEPEFGQKSQQKTME